MHYSRSVSILNQYIVGIQGVSDQVNAHLTIRCNNDDMKQFNIWLHVTSLYDTQAYITRNHTDQVYYTYIKHTDKQRYQLSKNTFKSLNQKITLIDDNVLNLEAEI